MRNEPNQNTGVSRLIHVSKYDIITRKSLPPYNNLKTTSSFLSELTTVYLVQTSHQFFICSHRQLSLI